MAEYDVVRTLTDDDQLSLWVGRVARAHASLEYSLTNVHEALSHGSEAPSAPHGVGQLITECRSLLRQASLSPDLVRAGVETLKAAKGASDERNRVMHDLWLDSALPSGPQDVKWAVFRREQKQPPAYGDGSPGRLSIVIHTHEHVVGARHRVSGLFMALHEVLPSRGLSGRPTKAPSSMHLYMALMEDRFTFDEFGGHLALDTSSTTPTQGGSA